MLIYHYTPLKTFHSIVKNVMESKDNDKYFEFWASSCFCMNDMVELRHGYNVLRDLLPYIEDQIDERLKISNIDNDTIILGKSSDYVSMLIKDNSINMDMMPYVISFSFMPDYLPMWYMYANRGEGVCLGFEHEEIEYNGSIGRPVIYNYEKTEEDYKKSIKDIIEKEYSDYLMRIKSVKNNINELWHQKMSSIRVICTLLSPFFKHPAFEFEHEYRLIQYGSKSKVENRQTEKGAVISYVKIKIPFQSLKKVIIGPCAQGKSYNAIHTELKYCNPQHLVEIESSKLPFRNL